MSEITAPNNTEAVSPEETVPIPPRYWWLRRILVAVGVLVVLLIGMRWYWGHEAHRRLQAEIDRYRAAGEPIYPEDFDTPEVPDENNAALALQQAAEAITFPPDTELNLSALYSLEDCADRVHEVGKIIEANRAALDLVRRSRAMTGVDWGVRMRSPLIGGLIPLLTGPRQTARLLRAAVFDRHHLEDDAAAVELIRDTLQVSNTVDELGVLIAHLVSVAISSGATRTVEEIAPGLLIADSPSLGEHVPGGATREQVKALIAALLDEEGLRTGWLRGLYCERAWQLDVVHMLTRGNMPLSSLFTGASARPSMLEKVLGWIYRPIGELDAIKMMCLSSALARAGAASSYPAARELYPSFPTYGANVYSLTRVLSKVLLPSFERAMVLHFRTLAERRMAAVALAIRVYQVDHGHRPETLAELVPDYLPAVPTDPFAEDGRELGYRPNAPKPVLYSVNLNGMDENGALGKSPGRLIAYDKADLPFFLNGDRPRPKRSTTPATSAPALE